MLVLSRRKEESVLIDGRRIEVRVLGFRGDRVKLGISAPREITVVRGELPLRGGGEASKL
jgi:carbon storage regulator